MAQIRTQGSNTGLYVEEAGASSSAVKTGKGKKPDPGQLLTTLMINNYKLFDMKTGKGNDEFAALHAEAHKALNQFRLPSGEIRQDLDRLSTLKNTTQTLKHAILEIAKKSEENVLIEELFNDRAKSYAPKQVQVSFAPERGRISKIFGLKFSDKRKSSVPETMMQSMPLADQFSAMVRAINVYEGNSSEKKKYHPTNFPDVVEAVMAYCVQLEAIPEDDREREHSKARQLPKPDVQKEGNHTSEPGIQNKKQQKVEHASKSAGERSTEVGSAAVAQPEVEDPVIQSTEDAPITETPQEEMAVEDVSIGEPPVYRDKLETTYLEKLTKLSDQRRTEITTLLGKLERPEGFPKKIFQSSMISTIKKSMAQFGVEEMEAREAMIAGIAHIFPKIESSDNRLRLGRLLSRYLSRTDTLNKKPLGLPSFVRDPVSKVDRPPQEVISDDVRGEVLSKLIEMRFFGYPEKKELDLMVEKNLPRMATENPAAFLKVERSLMRALLGYSRRERGIYIGSNESMLSKAAISSMQIYFDEIEGGSHGNESADSAQNLVDIGKNLLTYLRTKPLQEQAEQDEYKQCVNSISANLERVGKANPVVLPDAFSCMCDTLMGELRRYRAAGKGEQFVADSVQLREHCNNTMLEVYKNWDLFTKNPDDIGKIGKACRDLSYAIAAFDQEDDLVLDTSGMYSVASPAAPPFVEQATENPSVIEQGEPLKNMTVSQMVEFLLTQVQHTNALLE